jgi:hypothetical protein
MDLWFEFRIDGVPDEATRKGIESSIRRVLNEDHNTDILIESEVIV